MGDRYILGTAEIENLSTLEAIADRVNTDALAASGINTGTYTATNEDLTTTVERVVHVVDSVKPAISGFALTPDALRSPNHKLVEVNVLDSVFDASQGTVCAQRDPQRARRRTDGRGDGRTHGDVIVVNVHTLQLRAERAGGGVPFAFYLSRFAFIVAP